MTHDSPRWDRRRLAKIGAAALALLSAPFCGACIATRMPGQSFQGTLPAPTDPQLDARRRLQVHVDTLGGEIGERNVWRPERLAAAERYLTGALEQAGLSVARYPYKSRGVEVASLEVTLTGHARPDQIVLVGAHYDSVEGSPGANDNGAGVAALLELARLASARKPARSMRFVFFPNEEPPFFQQEEMGSLVYARMCRARGDDIVAMFALDTLGFFSDAPGSQQYPAPFSWLYPDAANFVGFVGDTGSSALVKDAAGRFRQVARFPSEGLAAPDWITGVGFSDHWSFWQVGYPGVMITDTAFFRYAHYHTPEDTPDKVNTDALARIVVGLDAVFAQIADQP